MPNYPTISDARKLAKASNLRRCVIFFETDDAEIGYSSYGRSKALCDETRDLADQMYDTAGYWLSRKQGFVAGVPGQDTDLR